MSRIKEALVFKTDEECLEWFQSLTLQEQTEIVKDATEYMENVKKALQPIIESFMNLWLPNQLSHPIKREKKLKIISKPSK